MANKIKVKLILELRAAQMSQREICRTRHISQHSVIDVFRIANEKNLNFEDVRDKSDEEVYQLFFPDKFYVENLFKKPDYLSVHAELKKNGVTLKLLWQEYKERGVVEGAVSVGYTKFCEGYTEHVVANSLTNHLAHKPGIVCEVDWSGSTMSVVDRDTGEIIKVYLFVATLPYSQFSYVEPCLDMKQDSWLRCNVHMFEYFGGSTVRVTCDNLKTGVISHPREGDIILNDKYEDLRDEAVLTNQGIPKLLKKFSQFKLLLLDEWLLDDLSDEEKHFIFELVERRHDSTSTIFCTQYKKEDWHARLGGGVHADAIMDRIVHNVVWIYTGNLNMREYNSRQKLS